MKKLVNSLSDILNILEKYLGNTSGLKRLKVKLLLLGFIITIMDMIAILSFIPLIDVLTKDKFKLFLPSISSLSHETRFIYVLIFFLFINAIKFFIVTFTVRSQIENLYSLKGCIQKRLFEEIFLRTSNIKSKSFSSTFTLLTSDLNQFLSFGLIPMFSLITELTMVFIVVLFLLVYKPFVFFTVGLLICISIFGMHFFTKNKSVFYGALRSEGESNRTNIYNQIFLGFKEIKMYGLYDQINKQYFKYNSNYNLSESKQYFYNQFPRFFIELTSVVIIVVVSLVTMLYFGLPNVIEVLAFSAVAIFRIIPSITKISSYLQQIEYVSPIIFKLSDFVFPNEPKRILDSASVTLKDFNKLQISDLKFGFSDNQLIFDNASLEIGSCKTYFLTGSSGVGKSSLLDIILGIELPLQCSVKLNDVKIDYFDIPYKDMAIVPQHPFIFNDSLLNNITLFDETPDLVFLNEILDVLELKDYVSAISDGLNYRINDSVNNISGGQKQRLSIARALYSKRKLIFFDEATNALDGNMERRIIGKLYNFSQKYRVSYFFISHGSLDKLDIEYVHFVIKDKKILEV